MFAFKEYVSFNFVATVTICSDLEPKRINLPASTVSPPICHEVIGLHAMILVF